MDTALVYKRKSWDQTRECWGERGLPHEWYTAPIHFISRLIRFMTQKLVKHQFIIFYFRTLFPPTLPHLANELCEKASIDPQQRCWHLTMKDMNRVCTTYDDICQQHPNIRDYDYRSQANSKDWSNRRNIQKELLEQSILEM